MVLNYGVGENSWETFGLQGDPTSPSQRKSVQGVHLKDWCWAGSSNTLATWCKELIHYIRKDPDAGKDWGWKEKGMTEDEMVGWHHRLNGHEFKQAPGDGEGQGSLTCCSPWGCRVGHDWATKLNWKWEMKVLVTQSCLTLHDPITTACQASLFITNSRSLPKLMSIESVMPSNHLIFYCPLLLLPSNFPSIRVFSNGVSSLHQVTKILELQLQHQSFQWIFRTNFL